MCLLRQRRMCSSPNGALETEPVLLSEVPFAALQIASLAALPVATLAALFWHAVAFSPCPSLPGARVQNARAAGRKRRTRACWVLHGTNSAGSPLSSWTRAMGAKDARSPTPHQHRQCMPLLRQWWKNIALAPAASHAAPAPAGYAPPSPQMKYIFLAPVVSNCAPVPGQCAALVTFTETPTMPSPEQGWHPRCAPAAPTGRWSSTEVQPTSAIRNAYGLRRREHDRYWC